MKGSFTMVHHDQGYRSRKFWFSIYAMTLMLVAAILSHWLVVIQGLYTTLIGGITAVVAAYLTGNVIQQKVTAAAAVETTKAKLEAGQEEPSPEGQPPEGSPE